MAGGTIASPIPECVRAVSLRQLRRLQPVWHGHYANLSCVYASINALRLVLEPRCPVPASDCGQLFRFAIRLLDRTDKLATALERGIAPADWPSLVRGIADRAEDLACMRIALVHPCPDDAISFAQLIDVVRLAIDDRQVVLLALTGRYEHYTVIAGYSRTRFRLFDGYGCSWLNLIACDVASDAATARHRIAVHSLVTLGLAPSQQTDLLKDRHDYARTIS